MDVQCEARGSHGELRVGYYVAAQLGRWSMRLTQPALSVIQCDITADVDRRDEYWSTSPPFSLVLWVGTCMWSWKKARVRSWKGDTLHITARGRPIVEKETEYV